MRRNERIAKTLKIYRDYPSLFAEHSLKIKPFGWNAAFLNSPSKRRLYCSARQTGKTNTIAIDMMHFGLFADWRGTLPSDTHEAYCNIVSYTEKQAKIFLRRMKDLAQNSPFFSSHMKRPNQDEVEIDWVSGRGTSTFLPIGLGDTGFSSQGFSPAYMTIDERASIPDALLIAYLPSGVARDAVQAEASTPKGAQGAFWQKAAKARLGYRHYDNGWDGSSINGVYSSDPNARWVQFNAKTEWNPLASKEYLEDMREQFTHEMYLQEFECQFIGLGNYMYGRQDLSEALKSFEVMQPWHEIGCDVAGMGDDETVYCVVKRNERQAKVVYMDAEAKSNTVLIAKRLAGLRKEYDAQKIRLELNGEGKGVADSLVLLHDYAPEGIFMNQRLKTEMHVNVGRMLNHNLLDLSIFKDLNGKMMMQMQSIKKKGTGVGIKIETEDDRHDDWPSALALALRGLNPEGAMKVLRHDDGQPIDVGGRDAILRRKFGKAPRNIDWNKVRY